MVQQPRQVACHLAVMLPVSKQWCGVWFALSSTSCAAARAATARLLWCVPACRWGPGAVRLNVRLTDYET